MFERELDSGRSRSAKVRRSRGFSRPIPFPFPHERLLPRLCNEMQFRYALMTVVSLFLAIFAKFKMPEGLESFSRYPAQFRYLLTYLERKTAKIQRLASPRPIRSLRFFSRSYFGLPGYLSAWELGVGLTTPHRKIRCCY